MNKPLLLIILDGFGIAEDMEMPLRLQINQI